MYKVFHIVSVNGTVVDSVQTPLGNPDARMEPRLPFDQRQAAVSLGVDRDGTIILLSAHLSPRSNSGATCVTWRLRGGNLYRPGHSSPSPEFLDAADAYGIMVLDPSGDGEEGFSLGNAPECVNNPKCDRFVLKTELHRDMILRDRNHPSVLLW